MSEKEINETIAWLKGEKYLINETSTTMTEEFEREHLWELSRNHMINKIIKELEKKLEKIQIDKDYQFMVEQGTVEVYRDMLIKDITGMKCIDRENGKVMFEFETFNMETSKVLYGYIIAKKPPYYDDEIYLCHDGYCTSEVQKSLIFEEEHLEWAKEEIQNLDSPDDFKVMKIKITYEIGDV